MVEKTTGSKDGFTADWLMRGALARIGDAFDRFTGRRWTPSSSLATSELISRVKQLLDSEAKHVPGKGTVVPHNIKLKIQWDKFADDNDESLARLETELLTAAADHINDSLYYTFSPLKVAVTADYFTEGVKLTVSFDNFGAEDGEADMNVEVPSKDSEQAPVAGQDIDGSRCVTVRFSLGGVAKEKRLQFPPDGRLSVGRTGTNGLVIDDASVSKIHAVLVQSQTKGLSVADTGSTNGTFVNDERIAYGKSVAFKAGDILKFGTVAVEFSNIVESVDTKDPKADDTVAVGDIEFRSRSSIPETLPSIGASNDTLEIDPVGLGAKNDSTAEADTNRSLRETRQVDGESE